ncbi:MAG: hypothetical protein NTV51_29015 [Verrucomicrobia bacterium]|nr:hypothetical protein [Verrucomicrobiota bacterium]
MVEHRIFFPRDEKTARDFEESALDNRRDFEVEAFSLTQKMEFMRVLALRAPQFRPKNGDPGKLITAAEIQLFLPIVAELRKETSNKEFGSLLDRVYEKTRTTRDLGLPILLFR